MNHMKFRRITLAACLLSFAVVAFAAGSVDGEWQADLPGRDGTSPGTLKFKVDGGGKLTGSVSSSRGDNQIEDGKVEGDQISFKLLMGNRPVTLVFTGTVKGDEIQFNQKVPEFGADRDFVAKRKK